MAIGIAFRNAHVGYVFGRIAWVTRNGGRVWHRLPGPATEALAVGAKWSYRIVYSHSGCPGPCDERIQRSVTGSTTWQVINKPPSNGDGADLTIDGSDVLVTMMGNPAGGGVGHTFYVISQDDGSTWRVRQDPCAGAPRREWDTTAVALDGSTIDAVCARRARSGWSVVVSHDVGRTFSTRRPEPIRWAGAIAVEAQRLIVGTSAISGDGTVDYDVVSSPDDGATWSAPFVDRGTTGSDFEPAAKVDCVGNGCVYVADPHRLVISTDGGLTWHRIALRGRRRA